MARLMRRAIYLLVKKRNIGFLVELLIVIIRLNSIDNGRASLQHRLGIQSSIEERDSELEKSKVSETALQELINDVDSVISSRVKLDDRGNAVEIHVLADKSRNAKQIVRDVQSAVMARFGIDIDHRVISIAQVNHDNVTSKGHRLLFKGMEMVSEGVVTEVKVILSYGQKDFTGVCRGINTSRNIGRLISQSTLQAVMDFLSLGEIFVLEDVKELKLANHDAVVVAVTHIENGIEHLLAGSAFVRSDFKDAVIRATLNAVNRLIERLINR
jgi:hypothetical protein